MVLVFFHMLYIIGRLIYKKYSGVKHEDTNDEVEKKDGLNISVEVRQMIDPAIKEVPRKPYLFPTPVYIERYLTVMHVLNRPSYRRKIGKVVDFGSSRLGLMVHLKKIKEIAHIICVDIDDDLLRRCAVKVRPVAMDYLYPRTTPLSIDLYKGSVVENDQVLEGTDAVICVELIEHLYPDELRDLPYNIFGFIKPLVAIITTPNVEFNVIFSNSNCFRHIDHKFEWTRQQFQDWANNIVLRYPEYIVIFHDISFGPKDMEHLGPCTQMAEFRCINRQPSLIRGIPNLFNVVEKIAYPTKVDNRSDEEKILAQAVHLINIYSEEKTRYRKEIKLKVVFEMFTEVKITIDALRTILENAGWVIVDNDDDDPIIQVPITPISDDDNYSDDEENDIFEENGIHEENDIHEENVVLPMNQQQSTPHLAQIPENRSEPSLNVTNDTQNGFNNSVQNYYTQQSGTSSQQSLIQVGIYHPQQSGTLPPPSETYNPQQSGTYPQQSGTYNPPPSGTYNPQQSGTYNPQQSGTYNPQQSGTYYPQQSGTYYPPPSGIYNPPPSGIYNLPPNGIYSHPPSGIYIALSSGTYNPSPSGIYNPQQSGIYNPPPSGTYNPQQSGTYPQQSGIYNPQQSGTYYPQQSGNYYPQQSANYYPQQNANCPQKGENNYVPQDESNSAPQDENNSAPQDENNSVPQDENNSAPQEENNSAPQDENNSAPQDENHSVPQDENNYVSQDENNSAPQDENNCASQDENNYVPQDENNYAPHDENNYAPHDENDYVSQDENNCTSQDENNYALQDGNNYDPRDRNKQKLLNCQDTSSFQFCNRIEDNVALVSGSVDIIDLNTSSNSGLLRLDAVSDVSSTTEWPDLDLNSSLNYTIANMSAHDDNNLTTESVDDINQELHFVPNISCSSTSPQPLLCHYDQFCHSDSTFGNDSASGAWMMNDTFSSNKEAEVEEFPFNNSNHNNLSNSNNTSSTRLEVSNSESKISSIINDIEKQPGRSDCNPLLNINCITGSLPQYTSSPKILKVNLSNGKERSLFQTTNSDNKEIILESDETITSNEKPHMKTSSNTMISNALCSKRNLLENYHQVDKNGSKTLMAITNSNSSYNGASVSINDSDSSNDVSKNCILCSVHSNSSENCKHKYHQEPCRLDKSDQVESHSEKTSGRELQRNLDIDFLSSKKKHTPVNVEVGSKETLSLQKKAMEEVYLSTVDTNSTDCISRFKLESVVNSDRVNQDEINSISSPRNSNLIEAAPICPDIVNIVFNEQAFETRLEVDSAQNTDNVIYFPDCAKEVNTLRNKESPCTESKNVNDVQSTSFLTNIKENTEDNLQKINPIYEDSKLLSIIDVTEKIDGKIASPETIETPSNSWSPEIMDSGYPNSASAQDMTPEYDLSSIAHDQLPESESPSVAEAPRLGNLEPIEVENGDLANNNRDGEGNNMIAMEVNGIENLQPLIDVLENDLENENDIYVLENGFPIWLLRILEMANPMELDILHHEAGMDHDEGFDSTSSDQENDEAESDEWDADDTWYTY